MCTDSWPCAGAGSFLCALSTVDLLPVVAAASVPRGGPGRRSGGGPLLRVEAVQGAHVAAWASLTRPSVLACVVCLLVPSRGD